MNVEKPWERYSIREDDWKLSEAWRDLAGWKRHMLLGLSRWANHASVTAKMITQLNKGDGPLVFGRGPCWMPNPRAPSNFGIWHSWTCATFERFSLVPHRAKMWRVSWDETLWRPEKTPAAALMSFVAESREESGIGGAELPETVHEWRKR